MISKHKSTPKTSNAAIFIATLLTLTSIKSYSQTILIDFNINFSRVYNFASSSWSDVSRRTTASAVLNLDDTKLRGVYYWGNQIQTIDTFFGAPTIASEFSATLPSPANPESWTKRSTSFSIATNIDYSISWPDTFMGKGPFVNYQINDAFTGTLNGQVWDYIVGFNLAGPGFAAQDIRQLSGSEILGYIQATALEKRNFTVGFNSRVYDQSTFQNLYGQSFQGTASISGVTILSAVTEPSKGFLMLLALPLLAGLGLKRRSKPIGRPTIGRSDA